MNDWSIKAIQDLVLEREEWTKKNLYATDSGKCPTGLYYQLLGYKPTNPDEPKGLRRMEVGNMVESNQIKKLKSLGILIEAQRRIEDKEYKVSGRHDGIIISPTECTDEAKKMIERKKEIFKAIGKLDLYLGKTLEEYIEEKIDQTKFLSIQEEINRQRQDLFDEERKLNKELLVPNPKNSLIVMEIKSIVEAGFKWRQSDGRPMEEHNKQLMFYLWKLREAYPWILGRVIYVDTSYQNILELNVDFDEEVINELKKFWKYINDCIENKTPPVLIPSIIQNPKTGLWQMNYQADWCKYHIHCTGDANWKTKALQEIERLNANITPTRRSYSRKK